MVVSMDRCFFFLLTEPVNRTHNLNKRPVSDVLTSAIYNLVDIKIKD